MGSFIKTREEAIFLTFIEVIEKKKKKFEDILPKTGGNFPVIQKTPANKASRWILSVFHEDIHLKKTYKMTPNLSHRYTIEW